MSNSKPLSFWCQLTDFPLDNLDLLYLSQIMTFFCAHAESTESAHLWTDDLVYRIKRHFKHQGLHEIPECLDVFKEPE